MSPGIVGPSPLKRRLRLSNVEPASRVVEAKRILLIAATTGYQTRVFADEARRLGLDLVLATDRRHVLDDPWGDAAVAIRFEDPSPGIESLIGQRRFDGIVAVGDTPAYVASQAAARLGLRFSPPEAVLASKNKFLARERFRESGLLSPGYRLLELSSDPDHAAATLYPCVLKPLNLSASRGVIRANTEPEFKNAFARIQKMLHAPESSLLVEDYIPGRELALEGLVTGGKLQVLAL